MFREGMNSKKEGVKENEDLFRDTGDGGGLAVIFSKVSLAHKTIPLLLRSL